MRSIGPLLLLIVATCGCGSQLDAPMSDDQPATERSGAEAQQAAGKPRLWLDEDSAAMIAAVSDYASASDHVYVVRWEGGCFRGYVRLQSDDGGRSVAYDLGMSPDHGRDAGALSGWLVVAMRRSPETTGEAYEVRIEEQFTVRVPEPDGGESATSYGRSHRGTLLRVPHDVDPNDWKSRELSRSGTDYIELRKWRDGESVAWLDFSVDAASLRADGDVDPPETGEQDRAL